MTVTPTTLKARWQEFASVDDSVVGTAIDEATRRTSVDDWGDRADDAIGLLACHNLSISPMGQAARLDAKQSGGSSVYWTQLQQMRRERFGGPWAIGPGMSE